MQAKKWVNQRSDRTTFSEPITSGHLALDTPLSIDVQTLNMKNKFCCRKSLISKNVTFSTCTVLKKMHDERHDLYT